MLKRERTYVVICNRWTAITLRMPNWFGVRRSSGSRPDKEMDKKTSEYFISELESESLLRGLKQLRSKIGSIPSKYALDRLALFDWNGRFDPQEYFEIFRLVKLNSEYLLDYVYKWHALGGYPLLYTRRAEDLRITSIEEFEREFSDTSQPFLSHVSFETSPSGFFQFALFCLEAPKFYLSWHDNYGDRELVCSSERIQEILKDIPSKASNPIDGMRTVSHEDREELSKLDLRPRVRISGDSAEVTALSFTKWGGFSWQIRDIAAPNKLLRVMNQPPIVEYNCGIVY